MVSSDRDIPLLTLRDIERAARRGLYDEPEQAPAHAEHSDAAIAGICPDPEMITKARPAAVLIPIVDRPSGATVVLTQRTTSLRHHSGQIAFPGGRVDASDATLLETALREAEEEIGLAREAVRPLGYLGPYFTTTGYRVTPVVGVIAPDSPVTLNPAEVADVFEVPLAFLMNPDNHQRHEREWQGAPRSYFAIPYGERYIWGVTAGIIRMLWQRLYAPHDP